MTMEIPLFSFGVVADVQYCEAPPAHGRYFQASLQKLTEALHTFQQQKVDFILDLGDLIDRSWDSFAPVLELYRQAGVPVRHTLGNHDFSVAEEHKTQVAQRIGLPPGGYYDFVWKGFRWVVLHGSEVSLFATRAGSLQQQQARQVLEALRQANQPHANAWNGGVSEAQLQWLHHVLDDAAAFQQPVIVAGHYPLYPEGTHNLWNAPALIDVLEAHAPVVAYFNGHQHEGGYAAKRGIHYLNFQGMVETASDNAYAVVAVFADRLQVSGFGREPDRVLWFRNH